MLTGLSAAPFGAVKLPECFIEREDTMSSSRGLKFILVGCAVLLMSGCGGEAVSSAMGNTITGEGLPNPAPTVVPGWGDLPAGREWGSTAGVDIDPFDGNVWAYERCGASSFGPGSLNCENNLVDPIFKFDRNTGEVLENFGAGLFVTPHGIHVDSDGNVWVTDFAGNAEGTKGHQVHKFSPTGELLMSLGMAGQPGSGPGQLNQPNDIVTGPDGSIYVSDGHNGQGMTSNQAINQGREEGSDGPHPQVHRGRHVHQRVGTDRHAARGVPHAARIGVRLPRSSVGRGSWQPPHRDLRSGRQLPRIAL